MHLLPLFLLGSAIAEAGLFEPASGREPLPARLVERGLVLPRGWTQLTVSGSHQSATRMHGGLGSATTLPYADPYTSVDLSLSHGLLPRMEAWVGLGRAREQIHGGPEGHEMRFTRRSEGIDPRIGVRWAVLEDDAHGHFLALEAGWLVATQEGDSQALGEVWDAVHLGAVGRERLGALQLTAQADWVVRPPCCNDPVAAERGGMDRYLLDGGDGPRFRGDAMVQAGPLYGVAGGVAWWRPADGVWPRDLRTEDVVYSPHHGADVFMGGGVQATRGLALTVRWTRPIWRAGFDHDRRDAVLDGLISGEVRGWF